MVAAHGVGLRTPCPEIDVAEIEAASYLDVSPATLYEILGALPERISEKRLSLAEPDREG